MYYKNCWRCTFLIEIAWFCHRSSFVIRASACFFKKKNKIEPNVSRVRGVNCGCFLLNIGALIWMFPNCKPSVIKASNKCKWMRVGAGRGRRVDNPGIVALGPLEIRTVPSFWNAALNHPSRERSPVCLAKLPKSRPFTGIMETFSNANRKIRTERRAIRRSVLSYHKQTTT